jgi:hypothetical protein
MKYWYFQEYYLWFRKIIFLIMRDAIFSGKICFWVDINDNKHEADFVD